MQRGSLFFLYYIIPGLLSAKSLKPNVLIIYTDEHNFRTLGCYRSILDKSQGEIWGEGVVVETPNIDFLAHNGAICSRFYTTTPLSSPSRSSFMTGLYPQQTGAVANDLPLNDSLRTFADDFSKAGYHTAYIGKWHLDGSDKPGWSPIRKFGFQDNRYMMNRGHYKRIIEKETGFDVTYNGKGTNSDNYMSDFLTNKAVHYIREHKTENFCCVIAYPDPHGPNIVRAPYNQMYSNFKFDKPITSYKQKEDFPSWARPTEPMEDMSQYFGMIKCIDDQIGILIKELKQNDLLDNTIVVFTSDHGDLCGEHGRINKSVPLDGSARVPFIMYYPPKIKKGIVVEEVISVIDFAPTILSLAEIQASTNRAGNDFSFLLENIKSNRSWKNIAFMRGADSQKGISKSWISVVHENLKLTLSERDGDLPWLSDMENDPNELVNEYDNPKYGKKLIHLFNELNSYGIRENDLRIRSNKIQTEINCKLNVLKTKF